MNWELLATSILIPAIVSYIAARFTYRHQRSIDFNYDYKRYILDKRKSAYDAIDSLIANTRKYRFVVTEVQEFKVHEFFVMGKKKENKFSPYLDMIYDVADKSLWMSAEIEQPLLELLDLMTKLSREISDGNYDYVEQVRLAHDNFKKIDDISIRISHAYFNDIVHMDDIEKFKQKKLFTASVPQQTL